MLIKKLSISALLMLTVIAPARAGEDYHFEKNDNGKGSLCYGGVEPHAMVNDRVVYVSQYHGWVPPKIAIKLPAASETNEERCVVIQSPMWDDEGASPFSLKAHGVLHPEATAESNVTNRNVKITVTQSVGGSISLPQTVGDVIMHDNALSPNNFHLSGLPARELNAMEDYSFVSTVVSGAKQVKTFHWLSGNVDFIWHFLEAQPALNIKTLADLRASHSQKPVDKQSPHFNIVLDHLASFLSHNTH